METRSVIIMTIKLEVEVDLIKTKMAGDWVL